MTCARAVAKGRTHAASGRPVVIRARRLPTFSNRVVGRGAFGDIDAILAFCEARG